VSDPAPRTGAISASLSRRTLLRASGLAAGAALFGSSRAAAAVTNPEVHLAYTVIGFTQGGLPLVVHHLGGGSTRLFLMGGQHGGPEFNTVNLVRFLIEHFQEHPWEIPESVGLDLLVMANPDGVAINSRQFLSGVDPNRNWPASNWSPDAFDSNARFVQGLGGPEPMSEQETWALAEWLLTERPALVINYHSAGGFMFGGGPLAEAYEAASRYFRSGGGGTPPGGAPGGTGSGSGLLPYRATGSMNPWLRTEGINGLFIELTTPYTAEFTRNLAGVRAVLGLLEYGSY
jgi:hypothetical protein